MRHRQGLGYGGYYGETIHSAARSCPVVSTVTDTVTLNLNPQCPALTLARREKKVFEKKVMEKFRCPPQLQLQPPPQSHTENVHSFVTSLFIDGFRNFENTIFLLLLILLLLPSFSDDSITLSTRGAYLIFVTFFTPTHFEA